MSLVQAIAVSDVPVADKRPAAEARPRAATPEVAPRRSPTMEALLGIERSVAGLRIVPALALVAALWWGQAVLIPVVLSIVISYALEPVIARLECRRVKRAIAVPLVLTMLLAGVIGGAYALRGEVVANPPT